METENKKILSIIIPTYNAAQFLDKGLSSFIIDDNSLLNMLDIIVVNDGSTDNSVEIAQKYVNKYPDVYRILNKENGGHGSAINEGVKIIKGSYFKVVDADDWVNTDVLKETICYLKDNENKHENFAVSHEKPNNISVDDIRTQLNNDIVIKPYSSKYKIYIVDEAEKMNQQAQNALLKTIEEPPSYAVIMLLTTNADSFLQTIRSRCITLNMKSVKDEVIKAYLMNEKHIPDYQADISAAFAQGIVGKAVKLASSDEFNELKESALSLIKRLDDIDLYELGAAVKQIAEYKLKVQDYFDLIMVWYRDVLYMKATNDVNGLIFKDEVYDIKKQAAKHSYQGIEAILEALEKAKIRINANVNFDLVIELLLMTIKEN